MQTAVDIGIKFIEEDGSGFRNEVAIERGAEIPVMSSEIGFKPRDIDDGVLVTGITVDSKLLTEQLHIELPEGASDDSHMNTILSIDDASGNLTVKTNSPELNMSVEHYLLLPSAALKVKPVIKPHVMI